MYLSSDYLRNFDKDLYYKILLLESFEDQTWHTAADLAIASQLDARSVTKYLNDLTKNFQRYTQTQVALFIKNRRQGYALSALSEPIEHERFLIYLVQSTLKYQLLHEIFFEDFRTVYQFAQKHYISESTAHRKINELKQQLAEYGISLQRGTYIAQGEELTIRLYLHMTFWRLFRGKIWPYPTISVTDVKRIAESIMKFFNVRFNEIKKRRLEYLLGAFFLRKSQKHETEIRPEIVRFLENNVFFAQFCRGVSPGLPNYFQSMDDLASLFLMLLTREEYYADPAVKKELFFVHRQQDTFVYQAFYYTEKMVSAFQIGNHLLPERFPEAAEGYLLSGLTFAYLFPSVKETINGNGVHFWNQAHEKNPKLHTWVEQMLTNAWEETKNPVFYNRLFLGERYLTVLETMTTFEPVLPEFQLLLMTDLPLFEEQLLMKEISQFFNNRYRFYFLPADYRGTKVDLLISTSKIHHKPWSDLEYFVVTEDLTIKDYLRLAEKLESIAKKNEQK